MLLLWGLYFSNRGAFRRVRGRAPSVTHVSHFDAVISKWGMPPRCRSERVGAELAVGPATPTLSAPKRFRLRDGRLTPGRSAPAGGVLSLTCAIRYLAPALAGPSFHSRSSARPMWVPTPS
jgi:hypothetical protein